MNKSKAQVFHFDLYGKREEKYDFLNENSIGSINWKELNPQAPNYYFVNKDFNEQRDYENGFSVNDLFQKQSMGITSGNDAEYIDFSKERLVSNYGTNYIKRIDYRVFDLRYINYDASKLARARFEFMRNLFFENLAISFVRRSRNDIFVLPYLTKNIVDKCITSTLDNANIFPLYLYPETNPPTSSGQAIQTSFEEQPQRTPNLNAEIVRQISEKTGLALVPDDEVIPAEFQNFVIHKLPEEPFVRPNDWGYHNCFTPLDLLDYIYAVLHSPTYREKYKEFLKIDFPRVPYPKDPDTFWKLVKLGGEIRQIHLLESPIVESYITQYPIDGDNVVTKPRFVHSPPVEGCPQDGVVNYPQKNIPQDGVVKYRNSKNYFNLPYNPKLKERARALRQAGNLSEVLFWNQVKNKQFKGFDFDRQKIIGNYIVDFYCSNCNVVIEIDGSSHDDKQAYDKERENFLESLGLVVIHIPVVDVMNNMNGIMTMLEEHSALQEEIPPRPPMADTPPKEGNFGRVYINESQYFDNVPQAAWEFYIGGYQPAQKWLKDRKDRTLEFDDILHYQKIIVALTETDRLMKAIDKIDIE